MKDPGIATIEIDGAISKVCHHYRISITGGGRVVPPASVAIWIFQIVILVSPASLEGMVSFAPFRRL